VKLDVIVEVSVSTRSISEKTAQAVLELVFQGFSKEIPTRNTQLQGLPSGETEHRDVSHLWKHELISVLIIVNRVVPDAMMAELADKAIRHVMLKIGDTIGMDIVGNAVETAIEFAGTAKNTVVQGLRRALDVARRKLLDEDE
jgi:hypothetical protein